MNSVVHPCTPIHLASSSPKSIFTVSLNVYLPISPPTHNTISSSPPQNGQPVPHTLPSTAEPSHPMITRARAGMRKPRVFTTFSPLPLDVVSESEPLTTATALSNQQWKQAMDS